MDRIRAASFFMWGAVAGFGLLYAVIHDRIDRAPAGQRVGATVAEKANVVPRSRPVQQPMASYDENPAATQRILNGDYRPQPISLPGASPQDKSAKECLAQTGGEINDAYVRCRYGTSQ